MRLVSFLGQGLVILAFGSLALGCSDDDKSDSTNTTTGTGGSGVGAGSQFWYQNDTFGNPLKTHTASEANLAAQVLVIVNQERQAAGVAAVAFDVEALTAALAHSHDMLGRGFFDHITPEGWSPSDRLVTLGASGYSAVGENIAAGQPDAAAVMTAWMNSPGHRDNILNPIFTHIGIGVAEGPQIHWTQVFLRRP